MLLPGLVAEVNFEANRNQLFPEDFRFGFFISYSAGYTTDGGVQRTEVGNQGRPWPWAPAGFGPASWGATPAVWRSYPSLPASGWAAPALASADATRAAARAKEQAEAGGGRSGDDPPTVAASLGPVASQEIVATVASRRGAP
jgi:hypothetical protein